MAEANLHVYAVVFVDLTSMLEALFHANSQRTIISDDEDSDMIMDIRD